MAAELLKAWNAPRLVTAVQINAATKVAHTQKATTVSSLTVGGNLSWTQLDQALPMPVDWNDEIVKLAVNSSDFMESLNQEILKITGLTATKYVLKIDGNQVGEFTRDELAAGINLAERDTPMTRQAKEVHQLTIQHNNLHFERWREIQVRLAKHTSGKIAKATDNLLATFDSEEAGLVAKQRKLARPVKHQYELCALN